MKIKLTTLFFIIISSFNFAFANESLNQLRKGEVIIEDIIDSKTEEGHVKMTFYVNEPAEKIWKLLVNYEEWTNFMDDLEEIKIRTKKKNYAIVYIKAKVPLNINVYYVIKRTYEKEKYLITWDFIEGKAKDMKGSWKIVPISKSQSKLIYTNYVDLGFFVPQNIVNILTKKKLPDLAKNIRKYLKNKS